MEERSDPKTRPFRGATTSYILAFSHAPIPEGVTTAFGEDDDDPACVALANRLRRSLPDYSLVFTGPNGDPPTTKRLHRVIQHGYTQTANEPEIHEAFGLMLDALRHITLNRPLKSIRKDDNTSDSLGDIDPVAAMLAGSIMQIGDRICSLRLLETTNFILT